MNTSSGWVTRVGLFESEQKDALELRKKKQKGKKVEKIIAYYLGISDDFTNKINA